MNGVEQPKLNIITPEVPALPPAVWLDNGVEVNAVPLFSTDLVTVSIMFTGGQWMQGKRLQSDYAMWLLKSGTERCSSEEVAERLDYYGATLTAGSALSHCFVQLTCLRRTLSEVLPLFCEVLTSPVYEQQRLENAREEGIMSYQVSEQKVAQVSKRIFYQQLLGTAHPAAQHPREEDYHAIQREDLLAYHQRFIQLSNAIVYVTGKTDASLMELLNRHLGGIPCGAQRLFQHPHADIVTAAQKMHEAELSVPSVQSGLRLGKVVPSFSDADYPTLSLTSTILGGYFGSRLMKNIRERLGFTYGIGSTFFPLPHNNVLIIATETPREHVARCIEEIKKEIADMQLHPVGDEEFQHARNFMLGQFCRMTETSLSLSTLLMSQRAYGRTLEHLLQEQRRIQALTPQDVMLCAQRHLSVEELLIVATHGKQAL